MATHYKHLLAAQSSWQARHRVRFRSGQDLSQGSEQPSNGSRNGSALPQAGWTLTRSDRGLPAGQKEAGSGQHPEVLAGFTDARRGVGGRQSD